MCVLHVRVLQVRLEREIESSIDMAKIQKLASKISLIKPEVAVF